MGRYTGYAIEKTDSSMIFEFISEGSKGAIRKRVEYEQIGVNTYNLAFGDIDAETDDFDDTTVTDNQDTLKVLATVAETVKVFLNAYPEAYIYAKGGNWARTRLYRIGISNNLEAISKDFDIFGDLGDDEWVLYEKNKNYLAFLILKK